MVWCRQAINHYLSQCWLSFMSPYGVTRPQLRCMSPYGVTELNVSCFPTRGQMNPTLTHWDWVMHICVGTLTNIGSDNGLSPGRRQAIVRTNAGILLIGPLRTNFSAILIEIQAFSIWMNINFSHFLKFAITAPALLLLHPNLNVVKWYWDT